MKLTITAEAVHPEHAGMLTPTQQVAELLAAIGFTRAGSVPEAAPLPMPAPSVSSVPSAAAEEPASVLQEPSVQAAVAKRERGKPAPGRKRRTAEEVAEDEAAEAAGAASKPAARFFIHPESGTAWLTTDGTDGCKGDRDPLVEEVDEEVYRKFVADADKAKQPAISTGENRVGPEDEPEEDQIQDIADEHAEVEATKPADAPAATLEDVRNAAGRYVNTYGMPAAQADGQRIFESVLGPVPDGMKNADGTPVTAWKMSVVPAEKFAAVVAAFDEALSLNIFQRDRVS